MNPFEMMKNLGNIQARIKEFQDKLPRLEVTGEAAGGMVQARIDGTFLVKAIAVDPSLLDPKDPSLVQELMKSACADGHAKMKELLASEMNALHGASGLPPDLFGGMAGFP